MEINEFKIIYPSITSWINIQPLSDMHVGNALCDKDKFRKCVRRIKDDPSRYTILMGDSFDSILPDGDKRYDTQAIDQELDTPQKQMNWLERELYPIREKIIGIHTGNHEETVRKRHFHDYTQELADNLEVKYLGWIAFTTLKLYRKNSTERHSYKIFSGHSGYGGGRAGGNLNKIQDLAGSFTADIYLTGHTHQIIASKEILTSVDQHGHLVERARIFGVCGSFLKTYGVGTISYPEVKIMRPTRTGTITISIHPETQRLDVHE